MAVTVVVVDDHPGFRRMARRMLAEAGFDVIGEAVDGEAAVGVVVRLRPQLVLLDIQLPGIDGFAVARLVAEAGTGAVVVLTSSRSASDYGSRLAHSPAIGFLPKDELSGPALVDMLGVAG